ncbi:hypothetical protein [Aerosakkonema funiforme]|uniref:Uncharacterized protein n=1 Tax=Aerosakkonema funiforme FACHB-1375 TaxID=2949571 RepID=A0A926ZKQ5_9CYAN|nr:hypothetical protein [Aerosakkonema funiforme]MBD2185632.1 hypothetical protein [Aerosakkonema funiforme FACHB-1375]
MVQLIWRILLWLRGGTLNLLILAGVLLLIWGIFSPVGTLVWWVKEGSENLGFKPEEPKNLPAGKKSNFVAKPSNINCYIVFLPGVGDFSADELTPGEEEFLNRLVKSHANCVAVSDVFPYSAANESLGGRRPLAPLWRFANRADGWLDMADVLIKIRNLWRFAISADDRYGPIYNQGIATAIIDRMQAAHPIPQSSNQPFKIILIGTSGGAQVSLGAVPYLHQWLNAEINVVSVGGVFAGDKGFNVSQHIYHLRGRRDWVEDIGRVVFPSRWPWTVGSPFNQAVRDGRYTAKISGPHNHDGSQGYFGQDLAKGKDISYVDITLEEVNKLPIWSVQKPSAVRQGKSD